MANFADFHKIGSMTEKKIYFFVNYFLILTHCAISFLQKISNIKKEKHQKTLMRKLIFSFSL